MLFKRPAAGTRDPVAGNLRRSVATPGWGGIARIVSATANSLRGVRDAWATEAAIRQEMVLAALLAPLSFFVAANAWVWTALVASLLFVLAVEFLNTALERLCNHVTPERHEAIRITKDFGSAAVFFALVLAGLVWGVAVLTRFGLVS